MNATCRCGCGKPVGVYTKTRLTRGHHAGEPRRFLHGHWPRHRQPKTWAARFWTKVKQTAGCWEWTAARSTTGYGKFSTGTSLATPAHRVAWQLTYGEIPSGLGVLHHCDNPLCVRPDHLFVGTPKDNTQDALRKGRLRHGERHPHAKLTDANVQDIRNRAQSGESATCIAKDYPVTVHYLKYRILTGEKRQTASQLLSPITSANI